MKTVKQLLESKGRQVWCIAPEESVFAALEMMAAKETGALVVVSEGQVVGMLSERDYARKVILKGTSSRETTVREIMSTQVVYVQQSNSVEECLALMTEKRSRHLPVLEDGKLSGIVSIGDAVKAVIADKEFMLEQFENYIMTG